MITPTPDQEIAIQKIRDNLSYVIDADIGAGKTLPAAYAVKSLIEEGRVNTVYVLCTPAGRIQWANKLKEYYPDSLHRLVVKKGDTNWLQKNHISIVAYTELIKIPKMPFLDKEHTMVVVDESHKIKSYKAKCTKKTFLYFKNVKRKLLMSGTMMGTGFIDLYTQYKFLGIPHFPQTKKEFMIFYCRIVKKQYGNTSFDKIIGYKNIDQLQAIIKPYSYSFSVDKPNHTSLTRLIKEDKHYIREYNELISETIITPKIMGWERYRPAADIMQIFLHRAKVAIKMYEEFPQPTIVFYHYRIEKDMLDDEFREIPHDCIEGGMTHKAKIESLDSFRDGKTQVLIAQIKTITDSLDIQTATRVIFTGPTFSLIDYKQAVGRISRRGQKYPTSDIMIVIKDSIDEHIAEILHDRKTNYSQFKTTIRDIARKRFIPVSQRCSDQTPLFGIQN